MKIVIDCRFWGPKHTGLGIYTQHLVEHLAKIDSKNSYVLLIRSEDSETIYLPGNFLKKTVNVNAYSLKEQLVLPWILYSLHPDVVHFPSINVPVLYLGKYVVTIHDLIKHFFRGAQTTTRHHGIYWLKFISYLLVFRWIVFWSRIILVPSKTVKEELTSQFAVFPAKVRVTYEASVVDSIPSGGKTRSLPDKFAVYTGNAYPHKNLGRLVKVWRKVYSETGTKLVLVGARNIFASRIEGHIESEQAREYVHTLGYVSPDELIRIYKKASIYVFPSLSEGFGLPGLDAMTVGLPVVCSGIPVLREIYGPAAVYFDPKNEEEMAKSIIKILSNPKQRAELASLGRKRVTLYSWDKTAQDTLSSYHTL